MFKPLLHKKAAKYYGKLNDKTTKRINKAIDNIIKDPFKGENIKRLRGKLEGKYRYVVGDLRTVYLVFSEEETILIEAIGPRGDVYK